MLKKGNIIQERYQVTEFICEGGMSYIYQVEDLRLNKAWALKELKASQEISTDSMDYRQFEAEAQILAKLSHAAFPAVIDFFVDKGKAYLVEEWLEGDTLENHTGRGLPEKEIRAIMRQLIDALDYIHQKGIVYRDLKPQNVMITPQHKVLLVDFGIARFYKAGKSKDTSYVGTPGYAPPEQYGQGQTDARSDLYSLGACLYFMITGTHPPEDRFNLTLPEEYKKAVSEKMVQTLEKAMKIKPEERFQSTGELQDAFSPEKGKKEGLLVPVIMAVFLLVLIAGARIPAFFIVLLSLLIYGFIWALTEIKKKL